MVTRIDTHSSWSLVPTLGCTTPTRTGHCYHLFLVRDSNPGLSVRTDRPIQLDQRWLHCCDSLIISVVSQSNRELNPIETSTSPTLMRIQTTRPKGPLSWFLTDQSWMTITHQWEWSLLYRDESLIIWVVVCVITSLIHDSMYHSSLVVKDHVLSPCRPIFGIRTRGFNSPNPGLLDSEWWSLVTPPSVSLTPWMSDHQWWSSTLITHRWVITLSIVSLIHDPMSVVVSLITSLIHHSIYSFSLMVKDHSLTHSRSRVVFVSHLGFEPGPRTWEEWFLNTTPKVSLTPWMSDHHWW